MAEPARQRMAAPAPKQSAAPVRARPPKVARSPRAARDPRFMKTVDRLQRTTARATRPEEDKKATSTAPTSAPAIRPMARLIAPIPPIARPIEASAPIQPTT